MRGKAGAARGFRCASGENGRRKTRPTGGSGGAATEAGPAVWFGRAVEALTSGPDAGRWARHDGERASDSLGWRVAGLSGMSRLLGLGAEEMGLGRERSGRGGARFGPRMRERRPVGLGYVERGKRAVRGE